MKCLKTMALCAVLTSLLVGNSIASEKSIASEDSIFRADASYIEDVDVPIIIGVGVAIGPDYVGSDDYGASLLPFVNYTFSGSKRYIKLTGSKLSINLLNHPNFSAGPLLQFYGSRDDDVEDEVVKEMNEIDSGFNAGIFITYEIQEADSRNKIKFTLKYIGDLSDSYDGYLVNFDASYSRRVAKKWNVLVGAGTTYADGNYMDTYFSVNSGNRGSATPAELPDYSAGSGTRDVHAKIGTTWSFDKNWLGGGMATYDVLLGDASDSPIVDSRGDSNQMAVAVFAAYRW